MFREFVILIRWESDSTMFRFLLILLLLYLVIRYVRIVMSPGKKEEKVKGQTRKATREISEDRVEDVNFKEIPKDK